MTAFENWLIENYKDEQSIGAELFAQSLFQNPQVPPILDRTGDKEYRPDTFYKAGAMLLKEKEAENEQV